MAATSRLLTRRTAPAAKLRGLAYASSAAALRRANSASGRNISPRTATSSGSGRRIGTEPIVFTLAVTSLPTAPLPRVTARCSVPAR